MSKRVKQTLDKETVFEQFTKPCFKQRFSELRQNLHPQKPAPPKIESKSK